MISLSKIFNINKLKYSLNESEDEFNVTAPQEWNVEYLTVGNQIMPDMWLHDILIINTSKPLTIEDIGEDDDGYWIKFEQYDALFDLDEVNDNLKPEYKIIESLSESTDEFTVDAPKSWNTQDLKKGDPVPSDFIDWTTVKDDIEDYYDGGLKHFINDLKQQKIRFFDWDNEDEDLFSVKIGKNNKNTEWLGIWKQNINPKYNIDFWSESNNVNESDDEFNVDAPEEWNVTELGAGDTITPDMWIDGIFNQSYRKWNLENHKIVDVRKWHDQLIVIIEGLDGEDDAVGFNWINDHLKPQYKIVVSDLTEGEEDEFNVDAPEEWNEGTLEVGDFIGPNENKVYQNEEEIPENLRPFTYQIIYIGPNEDSEYYEHNFYDWNIVTIQNVSDKKIYNFTLKFFNDHYGPYLNAKVDYPERSNVNESEDEFTVDAPEEWNQTELKVGDIIDYTKVQNPSAWKEAGNGVEWIILNIDSKLVKFKNKGHIFNFPIDFTNSDILNQRYVIEPQLNESEDDEFTVDAPEEWNVTELGVGDQITPDMWENNQYAPNLQGKTAEITDIGVDDSGPYVMLTHKNPHWSLDYDLDVINNLLKPQYKIVVYDLTESEKDEFNVDAPEEWNQTELTVGDIITPDMWKEHWYTNKIKKKPRKIKSVTEDDLGIFFWVEGDVHLYANENLKPQYKVIPPLHESEDEFTVDAPESWNITELTVGDFITPEMWEPQYKKEIGEKRYKIKMVDPRMDSVFIKDLSGNLYAYSLNSFNSYYLLPQYQIVKSLTESEDDEFNVEAPIEWNEGTLEVGDYFNEYAGKIYHNEEDIPEDKRHLVYKIIYIGPNKGQYWERNHYNYNLVVLENYSNKKTYTFTVGYFNLTYGSELNAKVDYPERSNVNESEDDEFTVDAPPEWNMTYLTVGNTITSDMFKDLDQAKRSYGKSKEFKIVDIYQSTTGSWIIRLKASSWKLSDLLVNDDFLLKHFNEDLKPQYKVVLPNELNNLLETDDDEFTVEAPPEWNSFDGELVVDFTLRVGYVFVEEEDEDEFERLNPGIRYRMSYDDEPIYVHEVNQTEPFEIEMLQKYYDLDDFTPPLTKEHLLSWVDFDDEDLIYWIYELEIPTKEIKTYYTDVNFNPVRIPDSMKQRMDYYDSSNGDIDKIDFINSINESDDEFNVVAPEEWSDDFWEPETGLHGKELFKSFSKFVYENLKNHGVKRNDIKKYLEYLLDITWYDVEGYIGISGNKLFKDYESIMSDDNNWDELDESEDEFNVDAPKEWNIEYLTDGDTITPDMWIDGIFDQSSRKWNERNHKILSYAKWGTDEIVVIEGLDGIHDVVNLNWLHKHLKPQYKVVSPEYLLEQEDEFSEPIDAPEEWNVTELGPGDTIKGKMWDWRKIINMINREHGDDHAAINRDIEMWKQVYDEGVTIQSIEKQGDVPWIYFSGDLLDWGPNVRYINKLLSPGYKIEQPLTESDDEFNVEAPFEWNSIDLKKGMVYNEKTGEIWPSLKEVPEELKSMDLSWTSAHTYEITGLSPSLITITRVVNKNDSYQFPVDYFNKEYGPLINAYVPTDINENDDEFTVDAPAEWNEIGLEVGDTITPDMWDLEKVDYVFKFMSEKERQIIFNYPWYIKDIGKLLSKFKINNYLDAFGTNLVNISLKPGFRLNVPLTESDDEFTVDAPEEWNITELGIGDYITPEMINTPKDKRKWNWYHQVFGDPKRVPGWKIIRFTDTEIDDRLYVDLEHNGIENLFSVDSINKYLKPEYKIVPPLNETKLSRLLEMDDEFTVDAPQEWDVEELTVGDIITNDMWNPNTTKGKHFFDYIAPKDNGWEIISIDDDQEDDDRVYVTVMGVDSKIDFSDWLDKFNDYLKPQYKVYRSINESEDDFTVDAPQEWNISPKDLYDNGLEFEVILEDEFHVDFEENENNEWLEDAIIYQKSYYYGVIKDYFRYNKDLKDSINDETISEDYDVWDIINDSSPDNTEFYFGYFNENGKWEKTGPYDVFGEIRTKVGEDIDFGDMTGKSDLEWNIKYVSNLNESEDDFTVDAPEEWNVQTLGVGDFLTPENSNTGRHYKITKIEGDRVFVRKGDMLRRDSGDIFVPDTPRDVYIYKNTLQAKLKPGYELDLDTINESDDDFNIGLGPWDNFSSEYQELEDKFGPKTASQMRNRFKDTFANPNELFKMLNNKSDVWFEIFADAIEDGDDVEDAMSMADMVAQDQEDIDRGLELAQDILSRPNWKFRGEDDYVDQLWNQMNAEDNDYYNNMDTGPRDNLYDKLMDMIDNLDS